MLVSIRYRLEVLRSRGRVLTPSCLTSEDAMEAEVPKGSPPCYGIV